MPNPYVTTVQDRQLLACRKLMEAPSQQDISTDRVVDSLDFPAVTASVLFPTLEEQDMAFQWLQDHGFRPQQSNGCIVF